MNKPTWGIFKTPGQCLRDAQSAPPARRENEMINAGIYAIFAGIGGIFLLIVLFLVVAAFLF